jgi:hypothetical protein
MKIKMLRTQRGSVDGIHSQAYTEGTEYELSGKLLNIFLVNKWAVEVKAEVKAVEVKPEKIEVKAESVPSNKMETGSIDNKEDKRKRK